jgi:hypothetical protein
MTRFSLFKKFQQCAQRFCAKKPHEVGGFRRAPLSSDYECDAVMFFGKSAMEG